MRGQYLDHDGQPALQPGSNLQRDGWDELSALLGSHSPGVRLESVIQGWAYLDQFERGIQAYSEIESPTPEDDRWLGVCYFKLFDDANALSAFVRAGQRGAIGARVNQAHALMFLDRSEESTRILEQVDPERLSRYDQVLYFRVRSLDEETGGNIRLALRHAEEAWRRVQGIPEFSVLAPSVLAQLGVLYARYGRAQRALWHLERGIQMTGPGATEGAPQEGDCPHHAWSQRRRTKRTQLNGVDAGRHWTHGREDTPSWRRRLGIWRTRERHWALRRCNRACSRG
jgi:tetratricopeptide (TPR) repeat protein